MIDELGIVDYVSRIKHISLVLVFGWNQIYGCKSMIGI